MLLNVGEVQILELLAEFAVLRVLFIKHCSLIAFQIITLSVVVHLEYEYIEIVVLIIIGDSDSDGLIKCTFLLTYKVGVVKILKN